MYQVKRKFGGFAVIDAAGEEVKSFSGAGAKAAAEAHADALNSGDTTAEEQQSGGRGGHGRGGRGRGGR